MEDPTVVVATQDAVPSRKRRRPALSCAECRRRKVKCDRTNPCDPCKQLKGSTCTYSPEGLSSLKNLVPRFALAQASFSPGNVDGERIFNEASLPTAVVLPSPPKTISDDTTTISGRSFSENRSNGTGHNFDQSRLALRVGRIEQMLSSAKINGTVVETVKPRNLPARGLISKNRYFGTSHWMSALVEAQSFMCFEFNLNDPNDDDDDIKMTNIDAGAMFNSILSSCKVMARAIKAAQAPQWSIWGVSFTHSMPVRSVADELVGHTFEHTNQYIGFFTFHRSKKSMRGTGRVLRRCR